MNFIINRSRFIAFLLATVFFLSIPAPVGVITLQAADPVDLKFMSTYGETLTEGTLNNSAPMYTYSNLNPREVLNKWDFSRTGTYYLRYYLDAGQQVVFRVTKSNADQAEVSYRIYTTTSGALRSINTYRVYSFEKTDYVDYKTVTNTSNNWNVVNPTTNSAMFNLTKNTGFSIEYDGKRAQFYWNENNNNYPNAQTFYFVTNGIAEGRIYDFDLFYAQSVLTAAGGGDIVLAAGTPVSGRNTIHSAAELSKTNKIMTGVSGFTSTPIANADSANIEDEGKTVLDRLTDPANDDWPGSEVVKLKMSIDLPRIWDDDATVHAYSKTPASFPDLTLNLTNTKSNHFMQIIFRNITTAPTATMVAGNRQVAVLPITADNKLEFIISGLEAGQIYDSANFHLSGLTNDIQLKQTDITPYTIYTYPYYEIEAVDDQFYANITPYVGHAGYYLLARVESSNIHPVSMSELNQGNSAVPIKLPATSNLDSQYNYQVFFSASPFNDNGTVSGSNPLISSQVLEYKATLTDATVGSPNNFSVQNYKLAFTKSSENVGDLTMNLRWDIAKESILQNLAPANGDPLRIVYDINRTLTRGTDNRFAQVTAIVTLGSNGNVNNIEFEETDNAGKFVSGTWDYYTDPTSGKTIYRAYVTLKTKAYSGGSNADFIFPNIYFLNARPSAVNGEPKNIGASLYDTVTLDSYTVPEVPAPQNIRLGDVTTKSKSADGTDEVSIQALWSTPIDLLREYLNYLYDGTEKPTDASVTYSLYISQSENLLKSFANGSQITPLTSDYGTVTKTNDTRGDILYASKINNITDAQVLQQGNGDLREALRKGNSIVEIKNLSLNTDTLYHIEEIMNTAVTSGDSLALSYTLDGLDKNQKYYMAVKMVVAPPANDTKGLRSSVLSSVISETTKGDQDILDPSEADPPAPFFSEKEVNNIIATLTWSRVTDNLSVDAESMEYQIIRTKDSPLDDSKVGNTGLSFGEVWNSSMLGFETNVQQLQIYSGSGFVAVTGKELYEFITDNDPTLRLVDRTLGTNSIYYYYIRTKRVVNDANGKPVTKYSKWNGISLTSDPVKFPINLKIEQDMDYDHYTETIISFDAPITDVSKLGTEYNLQYQIKTDDDSWSSPVTMNPSSLTSTVSATDGYRHFVYKITGLTPNTLYSIRVRMQDIVNGDYSNYSTVVQTKTEFDQEEYDQDQATGEWMNFLSELLNKLLKEPYWVAKDTGSLFEVVYRPTMFNDFMAQGTGGLLQLAESNAAKSVYYLPASAVVMANNSNVGFKISSEHMDMIFSPKAVSTDYNDAVFKIAERIKEKSVSDYYIRITVTQTDVGSAVEGDQPLTKQANIEVEAVGSRENTTVWDKNIMTLLTKMTADTLASSSVKNEIIEAIEDNTANEEFVKLVTDIVDDVRRDFVKEVSTELGSATRHSYASEVLDAALILSAKDLDSAASVKAYQLISGTYISYEVTSFGDNKAIYTTAPGIYIFTGHTIVVPGLDKIQGAGSLSGIIGKYGLDDFFGKEGTFNLEAFATRYQIVGAIARMAGAPKGSEPFAWLSQNKGLTISTRNSDGSIQAQEAVYLVMALYEIRTGTKIATIQIRNYGLTSSMTGLSDTYKQSVRAAFELGICGGSDFDPKSNIKVREILEMFSSLNAKSML